jgi:hypothetical protein
LPIKLLKGIGAVKHTAKTDTAFKASAGLLQVPYKTLLRHPALENQTAKSTSTFNTWIGFHQTSGKILEETGAVKQGCRLVTGCSPNHACLTAKSEKIWRRKAFEPNIKLSQAFQLFLPAYFETESNSRQTRCPPVDF